MFQQRHNSEAGSPPQNHHIGLLDQYFDPYSIQKGAAEPLYVLNNDRII